MKADNGHTMPFGHTSRPVPAGPSIPEPSAAYFARQKCRRIMLDLDEMRTGQPVAARVCEALLLRELAKDLAPVILELMADVAGEPEPAEALA